MVFFACVHLALFHVTHYVTRHFHYTVAEGPRHWRHRRAALATDPCSDTFQAVFSSLPDTEWSFTELRRRSAAARHHNTPRLSDLPH